MEKTFAKVPDLRIVVDALDECDDTEQADLIEKLASLIHLKEYETLRVVITSRREPDILKRFESVATTIDLSLRLSKEDVNQDVQRYIQDRLRRSEKLRADDRFRRKVEKKLIGTTDVSSGIRDPFFEYQGFRNLTVFITYRGCSSTLAL